MQVVPRRRERRQHIHTAGQAGALGAVQAVARVQQDGIRGRALERGGVRQRGAVPAQARRSKDRDRDVPDPHAAGQALGAVGQRGRDRAFPAVGAGADRAVFVHGGHGLVARRPVDPASAVLLARLVRRQRGVGVLAVHVQFVGVGIVQENRRGGLAVAGGHTGKFKRSHDKIQIHRLALDAVVRARGAEGALPHIVGARVVQIVGEPRDPEVVAPFVKGGIRHAGAHPVAGGIQPLRTGIAVLGQAVKERLRDLGHLGGENAADVLILEVVVDRVAQPVGRGGVVVQPLLRRGGQAQQPRDVVGLAAGLLHRRGVGIKVRAERDAQPGAFVGVAPPLGGILRPVFLLAVPLAAEAAADDGKVDAGSLGLFPVDLALELGYVHALEHRGGHGPAACVEVVAQIVLLPGRGGRAEVRLGGAPLLCRAAHQHHRHDDHDQQAEQTQPQHKAAAAAFGAGTFLFLRRRGRVGARGLLPGLRGGRSRPGRAAVDFAFFWHGALPLLGRFYAVDRQY